LFIFWAQFMLLAASILLVVVWLLGLVTSWTFDGYIHVALVAALVLMLIRAFRGPGKSS
jgi:Family of unknown function (DUF5670)